MPHKVYPAARQGDCGSIWAKSRTVLIWNGSPRVGNNSFYHCVCLSRIINRPHSPSLEHDSVNILQVNRKEGRKTYYCHIYYHPRFVSFSDSVVYETRSTGTRTKRKEIDVGKDVILHSIITCPKCGHQKEETMPTDACQYFYKCERCKSTLKPQKGHCCVFCSYGTVPCPSIQQQQKCC